MNLEQHYRDLHTMAQHRSAEIDWTDTAAKAMQKALGESQDLEGVRLAAELRSKLSAARQAAYELEDYLRRREAETKGMTGQ